MPIGPPIVLFIPFPPVPLAEFPSQNHCCPLSIALQRVWMTGPPLPSYAVGHCCGQHLLWDCPHSPVPTGTCSQTSHLPVIPNLNSSPASESPMPGCTSVPNIAGPPESPALHGDTVEKESDQDVMITGYEQPTKPMTKVILSENHPLLATLPPQVVWDMMCKGKVHIL